ncbi:MAG: PaaI family thioesterase [Acidobacteriota bacterium]
MSFSHDIALRILTSPFSRQLGIELVDAQREHVVTRMAFRQENTTVADQVHGGAISALIDVTATAAAWVGLDPDKLPSFGTTVNLEVAFMAPAKSQDLRATGTVARRGSSLAFCNVDVHDSDDQLVAQGRAVYKLGKPAAS